MNKTTILIFILFVLVYLVFPPYSIKETFYTLDQDHLRKNFIHKYCSPNITPRWAQISGNNSNKSLKLKDKIVPELGFTQAACYPCYNKTCGFNIDLAKENIPIIVGDSRLAKVGPATV